VTYRVDDGGLKELQRDLKNLDPALQRAFRKSIRTAMKPLQRDLRNSARRRLPGDLGDQAAREIGLSVTNNRVALVWRPRKGQFSQRAALDRGLIRHPLYGDRDYWYTTKYAKARGWWSEPAAHGIDRAIEDVNNAITDALRRFATTGY
jgi:hypothetical protein